MRDFHTRKKERTEYFFKYRYGYKQRPCYGCNGSGYYDDNGSPRCGGCEGTGKEYYASPLQIAMRYYLNNGRPIIQVEKNENKKSCKMPHKAPRQN